ncbi:MAG: beta-mannosidase [Ruminococcus sp.]|nr:beta-mannosidase [Ruminococcus sp.]
MKNKFRRSAAFLSAAAMTAAMAGSAGVVTTTAETEMTVFPYTIEGENMTDATFWDKIYADEFPGFSGDGFTYITNDKASFEVTVPEDGMYQLSARCVQILDKGGRMQTISVNGVEYSMTAPYLDTWTDIDLGVIRLRKGTNEIAFLNKYGYLAVDTVTIKEAVFPDVTQADSVPCDPKATPEAKSLMKYLHSVYGKHIISGQQEIYGSGHTIQTTIRYDQEKDICVDSDGNEYTIDRDSEGVDKDGNKIYWHCTGADGKVYDYDEQNRGYKFVYYDQEFDWLKDLSGKYPAIRGFDFMNYNPLYGWEDGTTQRVIDWVKNKGGIATACWHINIPTDFANYTPGDAIDWSKCTYKVNKEFKIANAVKEGTKENEYLNMAIEDLAEQFKILQDNNVPIMFRPFHEAEGNPSITSDPIDGSGAWFWWSQDGAEDYKALWNYLYDQLTNKYDLHNILWENNLYAWSEYSGEWYPGDDCVDIIGWDKYDTMYNRHDGLTSGPNEDCNSSVYWSLKDYTDNKKMAAITENSTIPSLDNLTTEKATWLYFCTWYDDQDKFISGENYNNPESVKEMYQSEYCITLDELPKDLYSNGGTSDPDPEPEPDPETTPGDATGDGNVLLNDAVLIMQVLGNPDAYGVGGTDKNAISAEGMKNADVSGNGDGLTNKDALAVQKYLLNLGSLPETE